MKHLPPIYITYTSSRIFWSFHTSYRVCLVPTLIIHLCAWTAGADSSWSSNGFAIPLRASGRGMLHPIPGLDSWSFWEPASCADRRTVCGTAKRYTRSPLRQGRRPDAASCSYSQKALRYDELLLISYFGICLCRVAWSTRRAHSFSSRDLPPVR